MKWFVPSTIGIILASLLLFIIAGMPPSRLNNSVESRPTAINQLQTSSEAEAISRSLELARRDYGLQDVVWGTAARLMTLGEAVWLMGGYAPPEAAKVGRDLSMLVWLVVIRGPANPRVPGIQPNVRYESMVLTLDAVTGEVKGFSAGPATSPLPIPVSITPGVAPNVAVITPRPTLAQPLPAPTLVSTVPAGFSPAVTIIIPPTPSSTQAPTVTFTPLPPYPQPTLQILSTSRP